MFIDQAIHKQIELAALIEAGAYLWLPDVDNAPQIQAYLSPATVVGYGGAAGGGKSELGIGKALNQHADSMIMRRLGTELQPLIDRLLTLVGPERKGRGWTGGNVNRLVIPEWDKKIAFGSCPNLGDETKYQGHPHDFKFYDEATNFLLSQIRFLGTWLRNTRLPGQVCEQLLTFNPPQTSEGRFVLEYFAPWLDPQYKNPAAHGEIRHFVTVGVGQQQIDIEVPNKPCVLIENQPVFDFDASKYKPVEIIIPQSRTFIGARVTDNKYQSSAYMAQLQSLPEPLRSQMLNGDFYAGLQDSEWQVCPTAWVEAAMARWRPRYPKPHMDSMGVDVARGGNDNSILIPRHGSWYDEPRVYAGPKTPDGPTLVGLVAANLRDDATIHIDVVGVGGSPYDFLRQQRYHVIGVNGGATQGIEGYVTQGGMHFTNWKAMLWWMLREDLDPANNRGVELPPDKNLLRDLTAPLWRPVGGKVHVETREEIIKRIGRSPDWGSACVLARLHTPRMEQLRNKPPSFGHDPIAVVDHMADLGGHNPF